jgi:hypothetical protein
MLISDPDRIRIRPKVPDPDPQHWLSVLHIITINVPVVFMARYVMVLRSTTSLRGALEGVGPENRDFFGP